MRILRKGQHKNEGVSGAVVRREVNLLHSKELDLEDQRGAGGDGTREAALAVGHGGWDRELSLAAHLHPLDPLVPPLDDLAGAELEAEGLAPIDAGVELLAV